jgi:hypothetical protein
MKMICKEYIAVVVSEQGCMTTILFTPTVVI